MKVERTTTRTPKTEVVISDPAVLDRLREDFLASDEHGDAIVYFDEVQLYDEEATFTVTLTAAEATAIAKDEHGTVQQLIDLLQVEVTLPPPADDDDLAELKREALARVNAAREAMGLSRLEKFPRGQRQSHDGCPLAQALEASVTEEWATFPTVERADAAAHVWGYAKPPGGGMVRLPEVLRRFVTALDEGDFPELTDGDD